MTVSPWGTTPWRSATIVASRGNSLTREPNSHLAAGTLQIGGPARPVGIATTAGGNLRTLFAIEQVFEYNEIWQKSLN